MGIVAANACPIEIVGRVCRIKDARSTWSDKSRILAKGVAFLPVNAENWNENYAVMSELFFWAS